MFRGMWVFPGIAAGLGTWQIYRWERKKRMLAHREERSCVRALLFSPLLTVPSPFISIGIAPTRDITSISIVDSNDVLNEEFKHFEVNGVFLHHEELKVGPRSYDGESGYYIVTPIMLLDDKHTTILVNRGWLVVLFSLLRVCFVC